MLVAALNFLSLLWFLFCRTQRYKDIKSVSRRGRDFLFVLSEFAVCWGHWRAVRAERASASALSSLEKLRHLLLLFLHNRFDFRVLKRSSCSLFVFKSEARRRRSSIILTGCRNLNYLYIVLFEKSCNLFVVFHSW